MKTIYLQIQEDQLPTCPRNMEEITQRHIIIKLLKTPMIKRKSKKQPERGNTLDVEGEKKKTTDCLLEMIEARKSGRAISLLSLNKT